MTPREEAARLLKALQAYADMDAFRDRTTFQACVDLIIALQEEKEAADDLVQMVARGKSPCGHWKVYQHTEDGGKHIHCMQCSLEAEKARADRLEALLTQQRPYLQHKRDCELNKSVPYGEMLPSSPMDGGIRALTDSERQALKGKLRCTCKLAALLAPTSGEKEPTNG